MQIFKKLVGLATGLALALGVATSVHAAVSVTTNFYFDGACADCTAPGGSGPVTGTLTLSNYFLGDSITLSNFVSFTYNGSNIIDPFTVTSDGSGGAYMASSVVGSMGTIPGYNDFLVMFGDGVYFQTTSVGKFDVCPPCTKGGDTGGAATWNNQPQNNVPEPGSLALAGLAVTALAVIRRRKTS